MSQKKYLTKAVKFGGKSVTLYSLDGMTWSTRKDELHAIMERHEQQKVTFAQLKGEAASTERKPTHPKAFHPRPTLGAAAAAPVKGKLPAPAVVKEEPKAEKKSPLAAKAVAPKAVPATAKKPEKADKAARKAKASAKKQPKAPAKGKSKKAAA